MRNILTWGLLAMLAALPASAQQATPGVQNLIDGLRPEAGQRRGIRIPSAPPATPAQPDALTTTTAPPGIAAVALTITFATGSARLSPAAASVLDDLGRALSSAELAPFRFRVEGHTDTVGDAAMNQVLSDQRAATVREWLVQRHAIDPNRLEAIGFGEQQLLVPTRDDTPEPRNRRVQVLNIGG